MRTISNIFVQIALSFFLISNVFPSTFMVYITDKSSYYIGEKIQIKATVITCCGAGGVNPSNIKIELYKGNSYISTITNSTSLSNLYSNAISYDLPCTLVDGTNYYIKATSTVNINDFSSSYNYNGYTSIKRLSQTLINGATNLGTVPSTCGNYISYQSSITNTITYRAFRFGGPENIVGICNANFNAKLSMFDPSNGCYVQSISVPYGNCNPNIIENGAGLALVEAKNLGTTGTFNLEIGASGACRIGEKEVVNNEIYPNPVSENATLFISENEESYSLMNTQGTLVKTGVDTKINMNGVDKGLYILKVGKKSTKVVVE